MPGETGRARSRKSGRPDASSRRQASFWTHRGVEVRGETRAAAERRRHPKSLASFPMMRRALPFLGVPADLTALSASIAACEPFRIVTRPGVLECRACRRQAGLLVGTVMERSHTPLSIWFWGRLPCRLPDAGHVGGAVSAATWADTIRNCLRHPAQQRGGLRTASRACESVYGRDGPLEARGSTGLSHIPSATCGGAEPAVQCGEHRGCERDFCHNWRAIGQRIDADSSPPRGFIAIGVKITVMQSADRDRVLVTDLAPNCARLGEANMVRLARRAATDNARLSGDELAVFLIAQADSFRCDATAASFWFLRQDDWSRCRGLHQLHEDLFARCRRAVARDRAGRFLNRTCIDWIDASLSLKALSTRSACGGDQRVLGRHVFVDPICRLLLGLELRDASEQLLAQRR